MAANNSDFLEGTGGTVDPFSGLAPAMTPEEEATQRLMKLRYAAQQTSGANVGFQRDQQHGDTTPTTPEEQAAYDAYAKAHHLGNYSHGLGYNLARDPVTMGVLAAPAAITGLGAAIGGGTALGFGAGEGSLVGGPGLATAGVDSTAAEAAVNAAHVALPGGVPVGTPFSMASPSAASAAGGASGAAGAFKSFGLPALEALGPLAIQQATGGRTKEQKQLLAAQQQMALEAQKRQGQVQDQRMNQLAQQVLAFNPRNQLLAQMVGPQAAFSPEQAAQMVQGQPPAYDPKWTNYQGNDPKIRAQISEYVRRLNEYNAAESSRRDMVMGGFQAPGPGPAPINMPAPQAARKF